MNLCQKIEKENTLILDNNCCLKGENMPRMNCCIFNHPCPILCPSNLACIGGNNIINPILPTNQYGFFNNTAPGGIATNAIIPVTLSVGIGTAITASTTTSGAVTLLAGTYEISYFVEGTIPSGGTISAKLSLNGTDVPGSTLTNTATAGNVVNLGKTIIITVNQTSTLQLVNTTSETTTYSNASMSIKRL